MKNFIFKSSARASDLQKMFQLVLVKLDIILGEQRHQRADLARIIKMVDIDRHNEDLQKQVDEYFDETSHQTELEDK